MSRYDFGKEYQEPSGNLLEVGDHVVALVPRTIGDKTYAVGLAENKKGGRQIEIHMENKDGNISDFVYLATDNDKDFTREMTVVRIKQYIAATSPKTNTTPESIPAETWRKMFRAYNDLETEGDVIKFCNEFFAVRTTPFKVTVFADTYNGKVSRKIMDRGTTRVRFATEEERKAWRPYSVAADTEDSVVEEEDDRAPEI